jgi:hypothetical protein
VARPLASGGHICDSGRYCGNTHPKSSSFAGFEPSISVRKLLEELFSRRHVHRPFVTSFFQGFRLHSIRINNLPFGYILAESMRPIDTGCLEKTTLRHGYSQQWPRKPDSDAVREGLSIPATEDAARFLRFNGNLRLICYSRAEYCQSLIGERIRASDKIRHLLTSADSLLTQIGRQSYVGECRDL